MYSDEMYRGSCVEIQMVELLVDRYLEGIDGATGEPQKWEVQCK